MIKKIPGVLSFKFINIYPIGAVLSCTLYTIFFLCSIKCSAQKQCNIYYVTTSSGGAHQLGSIIRFNTSQNTENVVWSFGSGTDGAQPYGDLVYFPNNGLFYGMTFDGGTNDGAGTIFTFNRATNAENVVWNFGSGTDGSAPQEGHLVYYAANGLFYGMTLQGGTNINNGGITSGTIFSFNPTNNTENVLWNFGSGTDGILPEGDLVFNANNGLFYGITSLGGTGASNLGMGTIFTFDPATNIENVVYNFQGSPNDGYSPWGDLVYNTTNGLYYGMALQGGSTNSRGVIFSFDPTTNIETIVWNFGTGTDAAVPIRNLLYNTTNQLYYGMTAIGGANNQGTIFTFDPSNNTENVVWSFGSGTDGQSPEGNLTLNASNGFLYGTTENGGTHGYGIVFSFNMLTNTENVVWNFGHATDGKEPWGALVYDTTVTVQARITGTDTVCGGRSTTLSASGGATYVWSPGGTGSSITVSPSSNTTYSLVTSNNSCYDTTQTTVYPFTLVQPVVTGAAQECSGATDVLTVSGGATSYLWGNGNTTTTYTTGTIDADSSISVIAFNSVGCPDTAQFPITEISFPVVTLAPSATSCSGSPVTLVAATSGSSHFTYSWAPGGSTLDKITVKPATKTTYTVVVSNGCETTETTTVSVGNPQLTACCDKTIIQGDDTTITAYGSNLKSYKWTPSVGLTCDTCPTITVTPTATTTYTITGTDSVGCPIEREITITVETPCGNFIVPNVFTPNFAGPSGENSSLYIQTHGINEWSIFIYDRWGKEIFKSTTPTNYWAGQTESGSQAPDGVYYYLISAACQSTPYKKDGFVQLIR